MKTYKYLVICPYTNVKGSSSPSIQNLKLDRAKEMDASVRNSAMAILEITHHMFEAAENKMEQARQLYRKAEEAQKAANCLSEALSQHELSKEAKLMQGLIKKLDFVLEKRGEELSTTTDKYLDMKEYLIKYTCQVISEVGIGYYGPIAQDGSISV